jgi:hypothetical protein
MKRESKRGMRRMRRLTAWSVVLCLGGLLSACSYLKAEFGFLDRVPPSCAGPASDAPSSAQSRP